jgi:c-di-GMP-binding flagellar brake protein YcgR
MDLNKIKRKNFRISVKENDTVSIKVNNVPYEIIDLNDGGIGIRLSPEDILVGIGDELTIELKIESLVRTLQGKVVHVSSSGSKDILSGIEFMNIDNETREELIEYLQSCREKIFKEE